MIAGVVLGPSLLGRIAPDLQAGLFPSGTSNIVLYTTAQVGLVLYMFVIGMNFDVDHVRQRAGTAAAVSATGTFAPLIIGALAAIPLLGGGEFFGEGVNLGMAMMFLGASIQDGRDGETIDTEIGGAGHQGFIRLGRPPGRARRCTCRSTTACST